MRTISTSPDTDRGFSLLEVLVVITVLGVLATVVVFAVRGGADDAEAAAHAADARVLETAEAAYAARNGEYAAEEELVAAGHLRQPSDLHDIVLEENGFRLVRTDGSVPAGDDGPGRDGESASVTTEPTTTTVPEAATTVPPTTVPTTVPPTTVPPTTAPPTPTGPIVCALTVTRAWDGGASADLSITNSTDRKITAWMVRVDTRGDRISLWNADTVSSSRTSFTAKNERWNGTVAAGSAVVPTGASIKGDRIEVGDVYPCEMVTPKPRLDDVTCDVDVTESWRDGGSVRLTIENDGDIDVSSWTVDLEAEDVRFTSWSGAEVVKQDDSHVTLTGQDWTSFIGAEDEMRSVTAQVAGRLRKSTSFDCEVVEVD